MTESDCLPVEQPIVPLPPWSTFALACTPNSVAPRCSTLGTCVPAAPGPEFKQCVAIVTDHVLLSCPSSYPDKSVFYHEMVDKRICTPCTCGAPKDSTCTGSIGLFSDATCGAPLAIVSIDATGPACYDIKPDGSALGSKSASEPKY
ncbi:MAG: hypothetical protein ACMG6S_24880, partial [Byssovorax sp.]